ncbi:hypothetical protein HYZ76_00365, partial [Candidatus Falkowbacteria bacterium]|nr:hypothetical protein [Candidatus Falkowbacteria bacterium]
MLLRKIKNKLEIILVDSLIKISLRFNFPKLAAVAFAIVAGRPGSKKAATVLAIGRSIFTHDLKALEDLSGKIKYEVVHLRYFYLIFDSFVKGPEREKITEENYHTENFCQAGKQKYYIFLKKMFPLFKGLTGFQAAISANFGYTAQQEFARVCEEEKTPFIVLHKEGIAAPDAYLDYVRQFKDRKFLGSKILFYNHQIKDAFTKIKISGMTEDKMEIVGIPRLDYCFINQENKNNEKQVVFFSFFPRDKFTYQIKDQNTLDSIKDNSAQFHKTVMEFALDHPDIKVVIMTKLAPHYIEYVKEIFSG